MLTPDIEHYIETHSMAESALLKAVRKATFQTTTHAHMMSDVIQGRLLSWLSHWIKPKTILEIGTFTGYSALCLAEGLSSDGHLMTIDNNDELESMVRGFLAQSPHGHQIDYTIADAKIHLPSIADNSLDLVFLDADKENYPWYYDQLVSKLKNQGVMIVDNVLWYGKVVDPIDDKDIQTHAIKAFNDKVNKDDGVRNLILPIRDGLQLIQKL